MTQPTIQQTFESAVRLYQAGRLPEAERLYRQILEQNPKHVGALHHLGVIAFRLGRNDIAEDLLRRAILHGPNDAASHCDFGTALFAAGKVDEALAAWRSSIALGPNRAEAHNNLGTALQDKGEFQEAIAAYRNAIRLKPEFAEPHSNLGTALFFNGQLEESVAAFRQAIALKPQDPEIHWNFALALLSLGRFAEGWEEYEWRLRRRPTNPDREFPQPYWNGSSAPDQTLLIYTEGGFGDAINSIRLIPMIASRVGKLIVECQPELLRIFEGTPGVHQWIARGEALPPFDCRISLQSLPRILQIRAETIPNSVPYLRPPQEQVRRWRGRIPQDGIRNIGLCWAGSQQDIISRTRSIDAFAPLAKISGLRFFSLQKGPESKQPPPPGMELIDHTQELNDFADTAALVENLDLVISVDTSIAHLAGALAKPVWVLVPNQWGFYWLLDRDDSPWYPTARLFRQSSPRDWQHVVDRIAAELTKWLKTCD